ncbi:hypothetical protein DFJ58DRAFT_763882 [Suillus subalutaceus]|uniref:uncharacterized protein n=1 Tax=Suillus subalutaceus TaxID=48586 RepID=UPI001B88115D|nr:uncharacterized protein DFJ58DRAFT_763882 [Suillus subalutaceus]KAG1870626.1 hypothetical protein DFJ58DRAFT_763882 [Suillus subalutaceus]
MMQQEDWSLASCGVISFKRVRLVFLDMFRPDQSIRIGLSDQHASSIDHVTRYPRALWAYWIRHTRRVWRRCSSDHDGSLPNVESVILSMSGYTGYMRLHSPSPCQQDGEMPVLIEKLGQHAFSIIARLLDLCLNHIMMILLMEFLNRYKCGKNSNASRERHWKQVPNITNSFNLYSVQIHVHRVRYSIAPVQYALRLRRSQLVAVNQ